MSSRRWKVEPVEVVCPECQRSRRVQRATAMAAKFTGVCVACNNRAIREAALARYEEIRRAKAAPVPKTKRRCLKCDAAFQSTGPGNRLCPRCAYQNRSVGDVYSVVL